MPAVAAAARDTDCELDLEQVECDNSILNLCARENLNLYHMHARWLCRETARLLVCETAAPRSGKCDSVTWMRNKVYTRAAGISAHDATSPSSEANALLLERHP